MRSRLAAAAVAAFAVLLAPSTAAASASSPTVPRFSHVMEVFLENESSSHTWDAATPYLHQLQRQGTFIPNFYGAGHASLDNYESAFAAVEPTTQGKADCLGMAYGSCIFPASVPTIGNLLDGAGLSWKVYSEGMAGAPGGGNCLHAVNRQAPDFYQGPGTNGYATRHNPAPWFDSIVTKGGSEAYCQAHDVDMSQLTSDLGSGATLPAFSFIEPDTCHDGHDDSGSQGCAADPEGPAYPSGVAAIEAWLPGFVHQVTTSPAWDSKSLLFITFDEGDATDANGCGPCGDTSAGGKIGAVAISGLARPGFVSSWKGDHYGFLRTLEASFGLPTLKSRAVSAAAAATVHDGDPGVKPLTDAWLSTAAPARSVSAAVTTSAPAAKASPAVALAPTGAGLEWRGLTGLILLLTGCLVALRRRFTPN